MMSEADNLMTIQAYRISDEIISIILFLLALIPSDYFVLLRS